MNIYKQQTSQRLYVNTTLSDGIYVSVFKGLSLQEYVNARQQCCTQMHRNCTDCPRMLQIAKEILEKGFTRLKDSYVQNFPHVKYDQTLARRRLLQMPLVCIRVDYSLGKSECLLLEHVLGVNYNNMRILLHKVVSTSNFTSHTTTMVSKNVVKSLLGLCQSDRERECVRYALFKSSGMSATQARKNLGFERMASRSEKVEQAIEHATYIRSSVEKLSKIKEKAVLRNLGIDWGDDSSSDESVDDEILEEPPLLPEFTQEELDVGEMTKLVKDSLFNWFEIDERLQKIYGWDKSQLQKLSQSIDSLQITSREKEMLSVSLEAYRLEEEISCNLQREADEVNGCIVSETDSDDPSAVHTSKSPLDPDLKTLIQKRRKAIRKQRQRLTAKKISKQNFLHRKTSKREDTILKKYPDIGEKIEEFVRDQNVGADKWRRTGVLTFDGNMKGKQKVTYERIRKHLEGIYDRKFAYGTIVQLCIARNRRHKSSSRYKGVAKVTTRRARKGFQLRYNPDFHWSNAFYRGLDFIQLTDGSNIINLNRDDSAGFRLDTLATNKQYASPMVAGDSVLTTHTDYVNRYPSTLQTSSYHFTRTKTTPEICAGVVKASPIHPKNAGQHAADFDMLKQQEELHAVFHKSNVDQKDILCVRVDGAVDEGPSHDEIQFFWTLEHIKYKRVASLITARSSGSSFLNRVELQNGCLSRGHSNLFIPSTLAGNCIVGGQIDQNILKESLNLAIDVYLDRVNRCPCGDGVIELFKGANSTQEQFYHDKLKIFLKGSKKKKQALQKEDPEVYELFQTVWDVRSRHMIPGLPRQYVYFLVCCYQEGCSHPVCQSTPGPNTLTWFPGGPPVNFIPLPVKDTSRPWGNQNCSECSGVCNGHYLKPEQLNFTSGSNPAFSPPPSAVIENAFKSKADADPESLAKETLLPTEEVVLWLEHLKRVSENRKRGAEKAAQARKVKKQVSESETNQFYFCGVCGSVYEDETDEIESWIACDKCSTWFHWSCVNITLEPSSFVCSHCS